MPHGGGLEVRLLPGPGVRGWEVPSAAAAAVAAAPPERSSLRLCVQAAPDSRCPPPSAYLEWEFNEEPGELPQLEKQPAGEAFCPEHNSQDQDKEGEDSSSVPKHATLTSSGFNHNKH